LTIEHAEASEGDVLAQLLRVFGTSEKKVALSNSPLFSDEADKWENLILYSTEKSLYWLHCSRTRATELQAVVEPKRIDARKAAESALAGLKDALSCWKPEVSSAEITELNRPIFIAQTGAWAHLTESAALLAVLVGITNVVWIGVAYISFAQDSLVDLLTGGIPAILTAVAFVLHGLLSGKRGLLRWKS
jgi:hypothetical protein